MTEEEIKKANPKMDLIKFSKNNDKAITRAIENTGNGYFLISFSSSTGKILQIKGTKTGKPLKRKPKLV